MSVREWHGNNHSRGGNVENACGRRERVVGGAGGGGSGESAVECAASAMAAAGDGSRDVAPLSQQERTQRTREGRSPQLPPPAVEERPSNVERRMYDGRT